MEPYPDLRRLPIFITMEGTEGSGKTTQGRALTAVLGKQTQVLLTREPGGTELGDRVRDLLFDVGGSRLDPVAQLLLLSAARAQHVREKLRPALRDHVTVICVRYADSSRAYQGGGDGLSADTVEAAIALATEGLEPDLTLYLDLDPRAGLARRSQDRLDGVTGTQEGWNSFDDRELAFHQRVRAAYLEIARNNSGRVVTVDAARPFETVHAEILQIVQRRITAHHTGGSF